MPTYKSRQAAKVFVKLAVQEVTGAPHQSGYLIDALTGVRLFPPLYFNSERAEIPANVTHKMRLALRLTEDEFDGLMRCDMTIDEYFSIRRQRDGTSHG